jgi:hypothetical protein
MCQYEDWGAYFVQSFNARRLWCRVCGFEEHENDHIERIEKEEEEEK